MRGVLFIPAVFELAFGIKAALLTTVGAAIEACREQHRAQVFKTHELLAAWTDHFRKSLMGMNRLEYEHDICSRSLLRP